MFLFTEEDTDKVDIFISRRKCNNSICHIGFIPKIVDLYGSCLSKDTVPIYTFIDYGLVPVFKDDSYSINKAHMLNFQFYFTIKKDGEMKVITDYNESNYNSRKELYDELFSYVFGLKIAKELINIDKEDILGELSKIFDNNYIIEKLDVEDKLVKEIVESFTFVYGTEMLDDDEEEF
jgi:hypothetical protein